MIPELKICCCGSIAIISVPNLILTLRLAYRTKITVVLTDSARRFITEHTFAALTGSQVIVDQGNGTDTQANDAPVLIAPATANALSAIASGLPTHPAANLAMSSTRRVFIAPAMNNQMWEHPATQRSVHRCHSYGHVVIMPEKGVEISDMTNSPSSLASIDSIVKSLIVNL
jgi:phosphopantothenoylcysteine decarboxylase/phosphopantothenate--cysteine ligase